jgi:hypothetical protein
LRLVVVATLFSVACAASTSDLSRARTAGYRTAFAHVWNALTREMHTAFPEITEEDAVRGVIASGWRAVDGAFFRMRAAVRGGPSTWTVTLEGEAAEQKPGMTLLVPFRPGAIDEPAWVRARVDRVYLNLYQTLEPHAVVVKPPHDPSAPPPMRARWSRQPAAAAELLARVHAAARALDGHSLRGLMIDAFVWSPGSDASADRALALWSADPAVFVSLRKALEGGCLGGPGAKEVTCGPATFRQVGARWWFVSFLAEGP